jgi:hypothetical protein
MTITQPLNLYMAENGAGNDVGAVVVDVVAGPGTTW